MIALTAAGSLVALRASLGAAQADKPKLFRPYSPMLRLCECDRFGLDAVIE